MSLRFGILVNELPFAAFYYLLASTWLATGQSGVNSPAGWVAVGLAVLATAGLVLVAWRSLQAGPAADHALSAGLGTGWRGRDHPPVAVGPPR